MSAALGIIAVTIVGVLLLGLRARHGREMDLEQWSVGGRGFGTILVFVLMAGEIYTTFTFLGGSGFAYGHGAPAFYILCYGCLAYIVSYWLLPPIWRYAKQHRLFAQPDFFARKYDSPALGVLVAIVGIVALVPYLVLQLKGLGIIVDAAAYGAIPTAWAICIGAAVVTVYVMISGVRGSAWTAVVKDTLILAVVLFLGIYLPIHYYGGFGAMFQAIQAAKPGFLALPPQGESLAWFDSTVLLTALGFYMWPHTFGSLYTAKEERAFRRNAALLPLYQLILLFVFFVGFRGHPAGARTEGARYRSVAAAPVDPKLRSLVRRRHRRGGGADGPGAGLDDPDGISYAAGEYPVPHHPAAGQRCRGRNRREVDGAGGRPGGRGVHDPGRQHDRCAAADGLCLRDAAFSVARRQPAAA